MNTNDVLACGSDIRTCLGNILTTIHTLGAVLQIACGVGASYALALASFHLFESPFLSLKRLFDTKDRSTPAQTERYVEAGAT